MMHAALSPLLPILLILEGLPIYLAGPMTGLPRWNFDLFADVALVLRDRGALVTSPHELELATGFDPDGDGAGFDLAAAMKRDIAAVMAAEVVALLPGWEASSGVAVEVAVAEACGIPCVPVEVLLGVPA